ncbi:hypothetical protein L3049_16515 [Labilibaculum sp. DW002]|uniref:Uncharacterized protein n=1 Tax=Paralabilibaculum antarcticum TaxID=2912572 RepID=A0ABT5VWA4_9BACT|nr:hypothetical protein [Labilibaculum sp. DW002]MDE5419596.1 hypothetical protein [Labilibaculum sp. DW002]
MSTSYFKFRQEELPVVGDILLQSFKRDRKQFKGFSEDYNDEYAKSVKAQIEKVQDLILAPRLTAEISKITEDLYANMEEIMPKLDLVGAYAQRANKSLRVRSSDFGVKECKKELRKKNVEGFSIKATMVLQNVENNYEALEAKGYKKELGTAIEKLAKKIYDLNLKQENKTSERKQLVVENHVELDKLWNMLTDISKLGKLLMRKDKAKAEDYMLTNVLTKVRKVPTKSVNQKKVTPPVAAQTPTAEAKKKEEEPQVEKA